MGELLMRRRMMAQREAAPASNVLQLPFTNARKIINISTGAEAYNADWYDTPFVEIPSGWSKISFTNPHTAQIAFRGAFYDSSQAFVTSQLTSVWSVGAGATGTKNIPSTAKYIRLSTNSSYPRNISLNYVLGN